jgi:hypothetical protein
MTQQPTDGNITSTITPVPAGFLTITLSYLCSIRWRSPVRIYKVRIDIHILADSCLVSAAPLARRLATNFVKGTSKVVDGFESYPICDFLKGITGVFNQFLGLLDAVLQ